MAATIAGQPSGAQRAYLQVIDFDDLEHVELIAKHVMPELA
ncbi:MAG: hypothetical protein ACYCU0_02945 [Solirubrobacteraceae bacterium]